MALSHRSAAHSVASISSDMLFNWLGCYITASRGTRPAVTALVAWNQVDWLGAGLVVK